MRATSEPDDFNELVTWACWMLIEGITKGEPLRQTVFAVLDYARRWKPADAAKGRG